MNDHDKIRVAVSMCQTAKRLREEAKSEQARGNSTRARIMESKADRLDSVRKRVTNG